MDKITHSHFKKLLTSQPYFVWNNLAIAPDVEDEEFDDEDGFAFSFDFDEVTDVAQITALEVQAKSFSIIERKFYEEQLKTSTDKLIVGKTHDERKNYTYEAMQNESVRRMIRPYFTFEKDDFNVVAMPTVYDKVDKKVSFLKLSASTSKTDLLRVFFDCLVLEKLGIEIKEISIFVLATKEYEKGEIDFYETDCICLSQSTNDTAKAAKANLNYSIMQLVKVGEDKVDKNGDDASIKLISVYRDKEISFGRPKKNFVLFDLDYYLDRIIDARKVTNPVYPQESDCGMWGANKAFGELVKLYAPQYDGFNGKMIKKQQIVEMEEIKDIANKSITLSQIIENSTPVVNNKEAVINLISNLQNKVVWYDFEAFSLPICPLKGLLPFQQTISQVSIIRTNNNIQIHEGTDNIVIDPLNIEHEDFVKLIKAIYWEGAYYVVYNKSYENTRLKEMIRILKKYEHDEVDNLSNMVDRIIENTIDLADAFSCSANEPAWIQIPFLKGKHSIKLLEKYITKKRPDVQYKIKEYQTLDIQNGMMAMELANNRALGIISDERWNLEVPKLKEYCENDVRAMIMVYHLIKELIK